MARIFISYRRARPDDVVAQRIHDHLIDLNHDVFLDTERLKVGDRWSGRIAHALETAHYVVAIISSAALRSEFIVRHELLPATERLRSGALRDILRVNIDGPHALPPPLAEILDPIQYAVWRSDDDTARVLQELADRLPPSTSLIRGARPFTEADAELFPRLGRSGSSERFVALLARAARKPVLLHGVSGAGKTSFVQAAVVPRFAPGDASVIELSDATVAGVERALSAARRVVIFDQFEQTLISVARDDQTRLALSSALLAPRSAGPQLVFCIREEYRTPFETMLPAVARTAVTFPLLPFRADEAAAILRRLLDDGGVGHDEQFLLPLCETLSEGVPPTVLPAILQVLAQQCRARGIVLDAAAWPQLSHRETSIFEEHVRERVLAQLPPRAAMLNGTRTLVALTSGEVKSGFKDAATIAAEQRVALDEVRRTLSIASGEARVVSVDVTASAAEPRYRLTHDLFVAPIRRLHMRALQRRAQLARAAIAAVVVAAALVSIGSAIRANLAARHTQRESAQRQYAAAVAELSNRDVASLLAAEAWKMSRTDDENRGTYALAALQQSLAGALPSFHVDTDYVPHFVPGSDYLVLEDLGSREIAIADSGGIRKKLHEYLDPDGAIAVNRQATAIAGYMMRRREPYPMIEDLATEETVDWPISDLPAASVFAAFSADGSVLVAAADNELRATDVSSGETLSVHSSLPFREAMIALEVSKPRAVIAEGNAIRVIDLQTGDAVTTRKAESPVESLAISRNGNHIATARRADKRTFAVELLDLTTGRSVRTTASRRPDATDDDDPDVFDLHLDDVSDDGRRLAAWSSHGHVYLFNAPDSVFDQSVHGLVGTLWRPYRRRVHFAGNGAYVAVIGGDETGWRVQWPQVRRRRTPPILYVWTTDGLRQWSRPIDLPEGTTGEGFSATRRWWRAVAGDGRVLAHDLHRGIPRIVSVHGPVAWSSGFAPDGSAVLLRSGGRSVVSLEPKITRFDIPLDLRSYTFEELRHGRYVALYTSAAQSTLQVVDASTGRRLFAKPYAMTGPITDVAVRRDGRVVRVMTGGSAVIAIDPASGAEQVQNVEGEEHVSQSFADDDGNFLTTRDSATIRSVRTGRTFTIRDPNASPATWALIGALVSGATFELANDGLTVHRPGGGRFRMTNTAEGTVTVKNLDSSRDLVFPQPRGGDFDAAVVGRRGRFVALFESYGSGNRLQIWDVAIGVPLTPPVELLSKYISAAFLRDDRELAVLTEDGVVRKFFVGDPVRAAGAAWIFDLAAVCTGKRLLPSGDVLLTPNELAASRERLRQALIRADAGDENARYALEALGWHR